MANTTISALPSATTPLAGTEVVPIVQSGVTKKVAVSAIGGGGSGTVTSVGISAPAFLSVSGSPVTTSGTLALSYSGTALPVANGGTGQTTANAALNGLLPSQSGQNGKVLSTDGTNTTWTAVTGTGTVTSVALSAPAFLTVSGSPITASGTLALSYSGTALPVANGGTGATTTTAAFDALAPTQTGNSGKYLTTNGATTSWATVSGGGSPAGADTQVQYNSGGTSFGASSAFTFTSATGLVTATGFAGALNGTVGATTPTTGVFTTATARSSAVQDSVTLQGRAGGTNSYGVTLTPTTLTGSRTLTLPDATGTILQSGTAVTVPQGGTGLTSGTSGGVPYFSAANTIASSAALTNNALMIGGGAGAAPATIATGTGVVGALGTNVGSAGAFVTNGGALGTPSGGTVTNLTGTASININGTVGATTPAAGTFTTVGYKGSTSGTITFQAPAVAGSATYTLPSSDGTSGQVLSTNGSGTLSWVTAGGGSSVTPTVEYLVVAGGGGGGGTNSGEPGGGGAGGYLTNAAYVVSASSTYNVVVGTGGSAGSIAVTGGNGSSSSFGTGTVTNSAATSGTITSVGGGGGGSAGPINADGANGGSGGGGSYQHTFGTATSGQGNNGGAGWSGGVSGGGGGGGAGGVGGTGASGSNGAGGIGINWNSLGTTYAIGGAAGSSNGSGPTAYTGNGGAGNYLTGYAGATGIVVVRYADTYPAATSTTGSPTITTSGGYRYYTWTGAGSITF